MREQELPFHWEMFFNMVNNQHGQRCEEDGVEIRQKGMAQVLEA